MIKDIKKLTLEEKIGQLFVVGFNEDYYSDKLDELIKTYKFGNILIFKRNIKSMEDLFNLNKEIQKNMIKHLDIPAFITIDQEGGMVTRLFDGATVFPGAMTLAATNNPDNAYKAGLYMATEMDALGVNVNFAPVLDVNTNPLNPGVGIRSYSDNQEMSSIYGVNYIKGIQEKIFATAKHFPGKGDAAVDAHVGLPRVEHDLKRLNEVEIYPFKKAIEANVKGVMTSHAIYKHLNNDVPATLSKEALTDLLRDDLKYKGLVFTDGMEMDAIDDLYGAPESAVTAILAGADIVLYCHYEDQQIKAFNFIKEAILDGTIPMEVLDDRVMRILEHKKEIDLPILNKEFSDVKHLVSKKEHQDFAKQVVEDAMTLAKGKLFKPLGKTLFIAQNPTALTLVEEDNKQKGLIEILQSELKDFTYVSTSVNPDKEESVKLITLAKDHDQVIFTTYNANMYKNQVKLMEELVKLNKDLHVVSLRNPYDTYLVKEIENYVCLYEYTNNSIYTLKKYLKGELIPNGVLPVKI